MKKFCVLSILLLIFILSSCTADTSGYSSELISKKWYTQLDNEAEAELYFFDDTAVFTIKNGDEETRIKGKYIADESTFVIFMPEIAQNYVFGYTPKGKQLVLRYRNSDILLTEKK